MPDSSPDQKQWKNPLQEGKIKNSSIIGKCEQFSGLVQVEEKFLNSIKFFNVDIENIKDDNFCEKYFQIRNQILRDSLRHIRWKLQQKVSELPCSKLRSLAQEICFQTDKAAALGQSYHKTNKIIYFHKNLYGQKEGVCTRKKKMIGRLFLNDLGFQLLKGYQGQGRTVKK